MTDLEMIQRLEDEHSSWWHFRRALRAEEQIAFDGLWRYAKRYAAASSTTSRPATFENALMGMLLGLARQLERRRPPAIYFVYDALGGPGTLPLICSDEKERVQAWIAAQENKGALRCVEVSAI